MGIIFPKNVILDVLTAALPPFQAILAGALMQGVLYKRQTIRRCFALRGDCAD